MAMIYVTDKKYEADIKVHEVSSKYSADLLYYVSEKKYEAKGKGEMLFGVLQKKNMKQKKRYIGKKVNIQLI